MFKAHSEKGTLRKTLGASQFSPKAQLLNRTWKQVVKEDITATAKSSPAPLERKLKTSLL